MEVRGNRALQVLYTNKSKEGLYFIYRGGG